MLQIWGRRNAFNVQKVLWLAGELGLPFVRMPAGGSEGPLDTPVFLALNPHGKVPVIQDADGTVVWESHSILRYLAARYGPGRFWDEDPARRSQAERWMDWAQASLQPAFLQGVFWGYYRTPPERRDEQAVAAAVARSAECFGALDRWLATRPYLAGDALTLADIPAGTHLYRYFELDIDRPALPHVQAWYERLQQRPAYREHVMVPFAELRGRLGY